MVVARMAHSYKVAKSVGAAPGREPAAQGATGCRHLRRSVVGARHARDRPPLRIASRAKERAALRPGPLLLQLILEAQVLHAASVAAHQLQRLDADADVV